MTSASGVEWSRFDNVSKRQFAYWINGFDVTPEADFTGAAALAPETLAGSGMLTGVASGVVLTCASDSPLPEFPFIASWA